MQNSKSGNNSKIMVYFADVCITAGVLLLFCALFDAMLHEKIFYKSFKHFQALQLTKHVFTLFLHYMFPFDFQKLKSKNTPRFLLILNLKTVSNSFELIMSYIVLYFEYKFDTITLTTILNHSCRYIYLLGIQ